MPKPNHGTKKKPGRSQWFRNRNILKEFKRRKDANDLKALLAFKKSQPKGR